MHIRTICFAPELLGSIFGYRQDTAQLWVCRSQNWEEGFRDKLSLTPAIHWPAAKPQPKTRAR